MTASGVLVVEGVALLVITACGTGAVAPAMPSRQDAVHPFEREAAAGVLSKAAAAARECSGAADPHGTGRIIVSFAPEGHITSAVIERGLTSPDGRPTGTDIRGTSVGNCVQSIFRKARVPPFSGGAVSVHKTFWL